VWRGDKFDEVGIGITTESGHCLRFFLGAAVQEVVELRALDEVFYPGLSAKKDEPARPSFIAFFDGTEERAGTVWPHSDGKGHRLKLRTAIADDSLVELRNTGHFLAFGEGQGLAKRRSYRPRPKV